MVLIEDRGSDSRLGVRLLDDENGQVGQIGSDFINLGIDLSSDVVQAVQDSF